MEIRIAEEGYMKRFLVAGCSLVFMLALAPPAHADSIIEGNTNWYEFLFRGSNPTGATGCTVSDCGPSSGGNSEFATGSGIWEFNSTTGGAFTITDAFLAGDYFRVYDWGNLVLTTPTVAFGAGCGSDPVDCLVDPLMSHGSVGYDSGYHKFSIEVFGPGGSADGAAYFRTDPVPEPASMLLFGTGALGLAARFRRRRQQQA
jgi:hypothetical protein